MPPVCPLHITITKMKDQSEYALLPTYDDSEQLATEKDENLSKPRAMCLQTIFSFLGLVWNYIKYFGDIYKYHILFIWTLVTLATLAILMREYPDICSAGRADHLDQIWSTNIFKLVVFFVSTLLMLGLQICDLGVVIVWTMTYAANTYSLCTSSMMIWLAMPALGCLVLKAAGYNCPSWLVELQCVYS